MADAIPSSPDVVGGANGVADRMPLDFRFWDDATLCGALSEKIR